MRFLTFAWIWVVGIFLTTSYALAVTYDYDAKNRLIRAEYTNGLIIEYVYDNAGNRLQVLTSMDTEDADGDGISDRDEESLTLTDPQNSDTDGDGIFDGEEDYDFDGVGNAEEIARGSSIFDPDVHLRVGLNLFAYPVSVPSGLSAFELLQSLGDDSEVESILRVDPDTQLYEKMSYVGGTPQGTDFSILSGEGYLVNMLAEKDVAYSGLPDSPTYDLVAGVNLIGVPFVPGGFDTYDLLEYLGDDTVISSLQILNPYTGHFMTTGYHSDSPAGPGTPVAAGQGILVYMKQDKVVAGLPAVIPTVRIMSPEDGDTLEVTSVPVTGTVDDVNAVVTVNGQFVSVDGSGNFSIDVPLAEGENDLTAIVRSQDNLASSHTIQVTVAP